MKQPGTESFTLPRRNEENATVLFGVALALYLFLRIFSWFNTSLLESRDSMSMIRDVKTFLTFDPSRIINMPPDTAPIYPLLSALFSLPGWPVEHSARLVSVFFSVVVFFSLAGIGRRMTTPHAVFLSMLLLTINPALVALSRSVLTEPAYIGLVYLALWLFLRHAENLTWKTGALLGAMFALAFLTRTEGLIYLVAIPVIQLTLVRFFQAKRSYKNFAIWAAAFVVSFCVVSAAQVWRVSSKMGLFAINGRQVWEVIMNNPDGKSYDQKIYGLDYSPQQINLEYMQSHPETVRAMTSSVSITELARKVFDNVLELFRNKLFALIGPLGAAIGICGLLALWRTRQYRTLVWIAGFLGASLAGPFLHDVDVRHIAVITPLLALLQGIGMVYLCRILTTVGRLRVYPKFMAIGIPSLLFIITVLGFFAPLHAALFPPRANREYAIDDYQAPRAALQQFKEQESKADLRIAARKGYFAYGAGAQEILLPYTDYSGLMEYCRLNRVDIIFVEHDELAGFPFYKKFEQHLVPGLELLHREQSESHGVLELYRVRPVP